MKKTIFLGIVLLLLSYSCNKNQCAFIDLGSFRMSTETKSKNPYSQTDKVVVFKDSLGVEFKFSIDYNNLDFKRNEITTACPDNDSESLVNSAILEYYTIILKNDELNLSFNLQIGLVPIYNLFSISKVGISKEVISILPFNKENQLFSDAFEYELKQFNLDGKEIAVFSRPDTIKDSHKLLDKTFQNVIYRNRFSDQSKYLLYYSIEKGIIGFEDFSSNKTYVFDRIEK